MRRWNWKLVVSVLVVLAGLSFGVFWLMTAPSTLSVAAFPEGYKPDLANGETVFNIGGCVSCHKRPGQADRLDLGGGLGLASPFGTFYAPNISPDKTYGIGEWSDRDFANALLRGVGRGGEHLYPALPYTSYHNLSVKDARDLFAYIRTLAPVTEPSKAHDVPFPFDIRRALGGWKFLFFDPAPFVPDPSKDAQWNRGAYLVEGPGHCAECHSPRNVLGAIKADQRFSGGPDPEGKGWVPNITPHADGLASWSEADIAEFLKSGLTPDFDSAGGSMAEVVQNTGRLGDADRAAMAKYIASLPARPGKAPPKEPAKAP